MPALVLFGQRTLVSGDDLRVNCILMITLRIVQLIVLIPLLIEARDVDRDDFRACAEEEDIGYVAKNANDIFYAYWSGSLFLVIVGVALEVTVWRTSVQGTPTEPEKRKRLVPLCTIKIIPIGILRVLLFTLGMILLVTVKEYCKCFDTDRRFLVEFKTSCSDYNRLYSLLAVVVFLHFLELWFSAVFALWFFFRAFRPRQRANALFGSFFSVSRERSWALTCRFCCTCSSVITCCLFGGKDTFNNDFADISMALAHYFDDGGNLDVTTSDVVVGLMMLLRMQEQRRLECKEVLQQDEDDCDRNTLDVEIGYQEQTEMNLSQEQNDPRPVDSGAVEVALDANDDASNNQKQVAKNKMSNVYQIRRSGSGLVYEPRVRAILSRDNEEDVATIAEGAHFINVAVAIYAWMMYFKNHTCSAHCIFVGSWMWDLLRCSPYPWRCRPKPNIIGDNCCGWNETALVRAAGLEEADIAYAQFRVGVAVTPYCIAIDHECKSIVLAIRGTLSFDDVAADISIRPQPLDEVGERCGFDGKGEFSHAGILACAEWIHSDLESHRILDLLLLGDDRKYPGYRFRIVGHSLGAGCAAVLSLMLRNKYPNLRCLCYEPPGCVLSMRSAELCNTYVTSFVHDADIICRLSLNSMEHLRDDVLEMIARIKVPKHQVLDSRFRRRGKGVLDLNAEQLHRRESTPESEFSRQLAEFKEHQKRNKEERDMQDVPLYPPGKIVLMLRKSEPKSCLRGMFSSPEQYTAQWNENGDFTEILVSSHMLSDHDGANVSRALDQLASSFGLEPPYATDDDKRL